MKRWKLIVLFAVLLVIGIAAVVLIQFQQFGTVAEISVDGVVVETVDLSAVTAAYTLQAGDGNTVLVEPGAISMHSANCPDQLCVKQGKITGSVYPIVCLPNRVTVRIVSEKGSGPDVIAGGVGS